MNAAFTKETPRQKWVVFISGALCIAAAGLSAHFYSVGKKETERRVAAENELATVQLELQLLTEKNRELAEQLREAKRIADEFAREKERLGMAAARASPGSESAGKASEVETPLPPKEGASIRELVNALRFERLSLAANRARESAGDVLGAVRAAFAFPRRRVDAEPSSASPGGRRLADVMKMFPSAGLAQIVADVRGSARKALGAVGSVFSSLGPASAAADPARLPAPSSTGTKLTATNEEILEELQEVRREKRELERQIAERTGKLAGSVDVGRVRIPTGRRFSGKVLVVNQKHNFVVVDVGRDQGLEKGEVFIVHRGSAFIGKAQVIKVYEKMAAADLIVDWMQDAVQVNDGVKKF
jgi:hypothetical protein